MTWKKRTLPAYNFGLSRSKGRAHLLPLPPPTNGTLRTERDMAVDSTCDMTTGGIKMREIFEDQAISAECTPLEIRTKHCGDCTDRCPYQAVSRARRLAYPSVRLCSLGIHRIPLQPQF